MKLHTAKKSMGQNFLKSAEALRAMCTASELTDKDIVLEIGPGKGALTEKLLEKANKVIAIEKDRDLIEILKEKLPSYISSGKLVLIEDDILEFNPSDHGLKAGQYKIVANIPYNITGAILKKFLQLVPSPISMTLLVQKEVAERIVARDGKESILSLSVKAYGQAKYVMKVAKRFFSPAPKVDSAIIHIGLISKGNFSNTDAESHFFEVIHAGFSHKRKYAKRNLESVGFAGSELDKMFEDLHINPQARAEDIPLSIWLAISRQKKA
ncbi:MAG: 16S rRNA (adenine(1518)-N(6)/adenine(1519)-N(6))-dimethyltransferase RsmA [bacterium]